MFINTQTPKKLLPINIFHRNVCKKWQAIINSNQKTIKGNSYRCIHYPLCGLSSPPTPPLYQKGRSATCWVFQAI